MVLIILVHRLLSIPVSVQQHTSDLLFSLLPRGACCKLFPSPVMSFWRFAKRWTECPFSFIVLSSFDDLFFHWRYFPDNSSGSHGSCCQPLLESSLRPLSFLYRHFNYCLASLVPSLLLDVIDIVVFDIYRIPIMLVLYCLIDYQGCLFFLTIHWFTDSCYQPLSDLLKFFLSWFSSFFWKP